MVTNTATEEHNTENVETFQRVHKVECSKIIKKKQLI